MVSRWEDIVMILFIFFVFADPIHGFAGIYQLEYAAITAIRRRSAGESGRKPDSGAEFCAAAQNDGSTRAAAPYAATAIAAAAATTAD